MTARAENGGQRRIVVGVDGSVPSKAALSWAVEQGRLTGAVVEAVIAWEFPATYGFPVSVSDVNWEQLATQVVSEAVAGVVSKAAPVKIMYKVVEGNAAQALLDEAAGADLLVVGNRGHGGFVEAAARVDQPALRASRRLPGRGDPRLGHRPRAGGRVTLMTAQASVGRSWSGLTVPRRRRRCAGLRRRRGFGACGCTLRTPGISRQSRRRTTRRRPPGRVRSAMRQRGSP